MIDRARKSFLEWPVWMRLMVLAAALMALNGLQWLDAPKAHGLRSQKVASCHLPLGGCGSASASRVGTR